MRHAEALPYSWKHGKTLVVPYILLPAVNKFCGVFYALNTPAKIGKQARRFIFFTACAVYLCVHKSFHTSH